VGLRRPWPSVASRVCTLRIRSGQDAYVLGCCKIPFLDVKCSPNNRHDRGPEYHDSDSLAELQGGEGAMKSTVVKRSIVLDGHKTSVSLEDGFWEGLKDIAKTKRKTLSDLVGGIDTDREHANLSSAIRLFVLNHYQARAA
jgi:predicted DNA-binding ribbon-helix-helix protein